MNKLIATIKYGSAKTKAFLALVFVLIFGGAALGIFGGVTFRLWALALGGLMVIGGLTAVLAANFSTVDIAPDDEFDVEHVDKREKRHKTVIRTDPVDGQEYSVEVDDDDEEVDFGVIDAVLPKNREKYDRRESVVQTEAEEDIHEFTAEEKAARYTPEVFKKVLHKYKVKKNYLPIIIDDSRSLNTEKTPALCWNKKDRVFFLLMEGNERVAEIPMNQFLRVRYEQNIQEKDIRDYDTIRKQMGVYDEFEDVMPTFNTQTDRMGRAQYFKNRYILGRDIAITPRSMRSLMTKYSFDLNIFDSLNVSGEYSIYFKKAYETRILWTDNVIGQQEYQNRIRGILETMADDEELDRLDFQDELDAMVRFRLITDEYADYYHQVRMRRDTQTKRR